MNASSLNLRRRLTFYVVFVASAIHSNPGLIAQGLPPGVPSGVTTITYHVWPLSQRDWSVVYREAEASLKKDAATGTFVSESFSALVDRTWSSGGEPPNEGKAAKEREAIENRFLSIKLTHYQSKIFAKIATEIRSIPEGAFVIRSEGSYEMKLLEGSWEDYESGGVMKLALANVDAERYAAKLLEAHRDARFRDWNAAQFREMTLVQFDRKPGPPDFPPNSLRSTIEKMNIHVAPEYREKGGVFVFEGGTLRFTADELATTIRVRGAVPLEKPLVFEKPAEAPRAPQTGLKPFDPARHGIETEKPIRERLPNAKWPPWRVAGSVLTGS